MRLKIHCVQKYSDAIGVRNSAFKSAAEAMKPAVVNSYFVSRLEVVERFHKAVCSDLRSHHFNDLVVNRSRRVVEAHQTMNSPGVTHFVKELVVSEATEDVAWKQRLHNLRQLTSEFIDLADSQPWLESFNSQRLQVGVGSVFAFRVSMDHVPAKSVCVC